MTPLGMVVAVLVFAGAFWLRQRAVRSAWVLIRLRQKLVALDGPASLAAPDPEGVLPERELAELVAASASALLVLLDTAPEMRLYETKVGTLLWALGGRGLRIEIWRFACEAGLVWRADGEPVRDLDGVLREQPSATVLVVSAGHESRMEAPWVRLLAQHPRVLWLHPLDEARHWPEDLQKAEMPLLVQPMTAEGFRRAAAWLRSDTTDRAPAQETPVTRGDVARMKRLLALVPAADAGLAEWLRQRFCSCVPRDVLIHLAAEQPHGSLAPGLLRWPGDALVSLFSGTPEERRSIAQVRHLLLERLKENEPPWPGSGAHLRWRIQRAAQWAHLDEARAVGELEDLARSPLWLEVDQVLGWLRVPGALEISGPLSVGPQMRRRLRRRVVPTLRALRAGQVPAGMDLGPAPRIWPRWWDLGLGLSAGLLASLLCIRAMPAWTRCPDAGAPVEVPKPDAGLVTDAGQMRGAEGPDAATPDLRALTESPRREATRPQGPRPHLARLDQGGAPDLLAPGPDLSVVPDLSAAQVPDLAAPQPDLTVVPDLSQPDQSVVPDLLVSRPDQSAVTAREVPLPDLSAGEAHARPSATMPSRMSSPAGRNRCPSIHDLKLELIAYPRGNVSAHVERQRCAQDRLQQVGGGRREGGG